MTHDYLISLIRTGVDLTDAELTRAARDVADAHRAQAIAETYRPNVTPPALTGSPGSGNRTM